MARIRAGSKLLAFFLALVLASIAQAATFTTDDAASGARPAGTAAVPRLRMTGMIDPGDGDRLSDMLVGLAAAMPGKPGEPWGTIELSSMGGNLADGFQIGTLLRKYGVIAVVRQRDICMSSCALALLRGNARHAEAGRRQECNLEIGAKVLIEGTGAYTTTYSAVGFNGFPPLKSYVI